MTTRIFPEFPGCAYSLMPPMWVGGRPGGGTAPLSRNDFALLHQEVMRRQLKSGIAVSVRRASAFFFDFSGWPPGAGVVSESQPSVDAVVEVVLNRVAVLNTHLACLYTALFRNEKHAPNKQVIAGPRDLIEVDGIDPVAAHQRMGTTSPTASRTSVLLDALTPHYTIRPQTVEQNLDALDEILTHPAEYAVQLSDLLLRACVAFEDQNNSLSLTICWTVIEKLLRRMWADYIQTNRERMIDGKLTPFINKARKEKLEGVDFTASVIAESLSLADVLEHSLYVDIDIARRARNRWLHGMTSPSAEDARLAINLTQSMLRAVDGIDLEINVFQVHSYSSGLNPEPPDDAV